VNERAQPVCWRDLWRKLHLWHPLWAGPEEDAHSRVHTMVRDTLGAARPLASMAAQEMDIDTVLSQAESMANPSHESFVGRSKTLVFRVSLDHIAGQPTGNKPCQGAPPCLMINSHCRGLCAGKALWGSVRVPSPSERSLLSRAALPGCPCPSPSHPSTGNAGLLPMVPVRVDSWGLGPFLRLGWLFGRMLLN
jgi:hypothetical protein